MVSVATETLTEPYELQRMIGAFSASSDVSLIVVVGGPDARVKASSRVGLDRPPDAEHPRTQLADFARAL